MYNKYNIKYETNPRNNSSEDILNTDDFLPSNLEMNSVVSSNSCNSIYDDNFDSDSSQFKRTVNDNSTYFDNNNEHIMEYLNDGIENHFDKIMYYQKMKFLISSNYSIECIKKLDSIPPIRIHELWKSVSLQIREILFNLFFIILSNRIRIWSNTDEKHKEFFIHWGDEYLKSIGNYFSISDEIKDQISNIYQLNFEDSNIEDLVSIEPLKNALKEYFVNDLQPKVDIIFSEYNNKTNNSNRLNNIVDAETFLFIRNMSAGNIILNKNKSIFKNERNKIDSLNIDNNRSSISLISLPSKFNNKFDNNLKLFNEINNFHEIPPKIVVKRRTWHAGTKEEYLINNPPSASLIIILTLLRLHVIDGLLNSRTLSILQDVFITLNENNEYYNSSLILFDYLQILTYNDPKKNKLKSDTRSLEKGWNKSWRYIKVAGATVLGGAILATATTIAAPGIIAGLGTLGITFSGLFGSALTVGTNTAALSAVAGFSGASLSGWKMSRRESPLKIFKFHEIGKNIEKKNGLLPILIGISGWLRNKDDIFIPWKIGFNGIEWMETYTVEFEPEILSQLGSSIALTMSQDLAIFAGKAILLQTVVGSLTAALSWPITLMQYAATLDNTWSVSRQKTEQAAIILADALCDKETTGNRPIKLIGYSMGARLIFLALQILYDRKQFSKIQDVILLGMPTSLNKKKWNKARCVVSNRLINVFTRSDWVLAFFYRYMQWGFHVAGISPVNFPGVENYDVTGMIHSHDQYPDKIRDILYYINFF